MGARFLRSSRCFKVTGLSIQLINWNRSPISTEPEGRQMSFYVQTWFPLLTVALTAAICLSVVSFIIGQSKSQQ
jgi:hypothetical protein